MTDKKEYLKKLNEHFDHIDYSQIPVCDDIPTGKTIDAVNGPHFVC